MGNVDESLQAVAAKALRAACDIGKGSDEAAADVARATVLSIVEELQGMHDEMLRQLLRSRGQVSKPREGEVYMVGEIARMILSMVEVAQ